MGLISGGWALPTQEIEVRKIKRLIIISKLKNDNSRVFFEDDSSMDHQCGRIPKKKEDYKREIEEFRRL